MTIGDKDMTARCDAPSRQTAAVSAVRALMDYAIACGCDRDALLRTSGIQMADLLEEEHRVPLRAYVALMDAAKEATGDAAFALHFGESDAGLESTLACMTGIFSPTMADAFDSLKAPGQPRPQAEAADERYAITREGEDLWIVDTWNSDFRDGKESGFARFVSAARKLFPGLRFVKAVHFTHEEPFYRAEYDRIFDTQVVFSSDCNAMRMDASWLEQRPHTPSPHAFELAKRRAEAFLQRAADERSMRGRVEAVLADLLQKAHVSIDHVARTLGVSRHTLFRKLRAEGATFTSVRDAFRRKLAVEYLRDHKLGVNETSYLLGFSDPAAFSRAFKRWTGQSPSSLAPARGAASQPAHTARPQRSRA